MKKRERETGGRERQMEEMETKRDGDKERLRQRDGENEMKTE
jgi:hypothetical protein